MENNEVLNEGLKYLKKTSTINPVSTKLGAEVVYNMVSLGIEAVLTHVLMSYDKMVDHSGISMMLRELESVEEVPEDWKTSARFMNKFQSYCSLEPIPAKVPDAEQLGKILDFGKMVEAYALEKAK